MPAPIFTLLIPNNGAVDIANGCAPTKGIREIYVHTMLVQERIRKGTLNVPQVPTAMFLASCITTFLAPLKLGRAGITLHLDASPHAGCDGLKKTTYGARRHGCSRKW